MNTPLRTKRAEFKFKIRPSSARVSPFKTVSGVFVPKKFSSSVFSVFVEPRTVRLATVIEPGKLTGVDGLIPTAFQFEFVIITVCELLGREPSDQLAAASQLPLAGLIHEFI